MTTITLPRAVVEQALEALEQSKTTVPYEGFGMARRVAERKHQAAIDALRAALAQQAEPVEPRWEGDDNITSPWNACMHKNYCVALKEERERRLAQQAEPVLPVESALQAVAEKIGDQCAVWYGIGARDVEAVLREAARYGLVHGAQAEPVGAVLVNRESREGVMFYSVDMIPDPATLKDRFELVKVYTAPPKRKPLTDEEIAAEWQKASECAGKSEAAVTASQFVQMFARAVERAHGIKE